MNTKLIQYNIHYFPPIHDYESIGFWIFVSPIAVYNNTFLMHQNSIHQGQKAKENLDYQNNTRQHKVYFTSLSLCFVFAPGLFPDFSSPIKLSPGVRIQRILSRQLVLVTFLQYFQTTIFSLQIRNIPMNYKLLYRNIVDKNSFISFFPLVLQTFVFRKYVI